MTTTSPTAISTNNPDPETHVPKNAGSLDGRKVSAWTKTKTWVSENKRAIAVILLIIGIAAALTGFGIALSAVMAGTAFVTATSATGLTLSGGAVIPSVTVTAGLTAAGKAIVGGFSALIAGVGLSCFSGGYLAGSRAKS